jgi:outer membrane protein TolC
MSAVIRIVKRKEREEMARAEEESLAPSKPDPSSIVNTVKTWIEASRERRQAELDLAIEFRRGHSFNKGARRQPAVVTNYLGVVLIAGLFLLSGHTTCNAQQTARTSETITLDQAIDIALRSNHSIKIAELGVNRTDEDIAAAKTSRLPAFHTYALFSGNLAKNELKVPNPAASQFPGLGPFFLLNLERKPSAVFAATTIQPLSQQYRIGLYIKLTKLGHEISQVKLRQQKDETIAQVKKTYYAILQTKSAISSLEEAVRSYQELDKVTGDYVVQKIVLKADHLVVQTRLAKAQYDELELSTRLATQKEQFNTLLGREVGAEFEVTDAPAFISVETNLVAARKVALEHRPELQQARLAVEAATLDRRIKKSEYIPDVSAGFVYLTPRNFPSVVPKEFANVGVVASWEVFDWGRKKHQLAEKNYAVEQAKNALKEAEDQVLVDVGDKLRKLQLSGEALHVARLAEDAAKENLRVSTGQYKFQAVMLSDVLRSQASLAEATNEYQRVLLTFWTAKAEFEKALGGDK